MLIEEQNNSVESSLVMSSISFVNSSKLLYLDFKSKACGKFDF